MTLVATSRGRAAGRGWRGELLTTWPVVTEAVYLSETPKARLAIMQWLQRNLQAVPLDAADTARIERFYRKYADQKTMNEFKALPRRARVVTAPAPILCGAAPLPLNRVTSVVLNPGEQVRWIWTSTPDGGSYVSGYTIVESGTRKTPKRRSRAKR